jgi:hypothetical protein
MPAGIPPFSRRLGALALAVPLLCAPVLSQEARGPVAVACSAAVAANDRDGLRLQQQQLLQPQGPPVSLDAVLQRAELLLACRAPEGALQVLNRISPAPGAERRRWLLVRWQAAAAGLHHREAADALVRLAAGDLGALQALELPIGATATRPALDLLAEHHQALGQSEQAAAVLLVGSRAGAAGAARLGWAVELASHLPQAERLQLLEQALEQAAEAGAWGLVAQLLDQQVALGGSPSAVERRLRLSGRLDDAYGAWRLSPTAELEQQLRSPRQPGGHAASPPSPARP